MPDQTEQHDLNFLESRMRRLERWHRIYAIGWVLTIILGGILILRESYLPAWALDTVLVHRLVVLDRSGKERIVIAAPLPDPVVDGKIQRRRTAVSAGLQFKDPDGTERGGIASEDDGSFMVGIDDQRGHERAHLYYIPNRGSGVYLQGDMGSETLSLLNPSEFGENPRIEVIDPHGTIVDRFPGAK